jgi:hypothetical protein
MQRNKNGVIKYRKELERKRILKYDINGLSYGKDRRKRND